MPDHIFDQLHIHNWIFSGCGAVGSARHLGCWGRRFEPCHSDHVAADGISFAATFFANVASHSFCRSSFPNQTRCRWASIRFFILIGAPFFVNAFRVVADCVSFAAAFVYFKTNAVSHSLRRSSFPRKAGGFAGAPNISGISLAPIFYKSQSACTPLLLLSKPDPLSLGSGLISVLLQSPLRTIQVRMASTICRREL